MIPDVLSPMLAQEAEEPFNSEDYLFEIKWDGIRAVVFVNDEVRLQSREQLDITAQFPELQALSLLPPDTILDGEIVVLKEGKPSLRRVLKRLQSTGRDRIHRLTLSMPAVFVAFDLPYLRGQSLMPQPLSKRRAMIESIFANARERIPTATVSEAMTCSGSELFNAVCEFDLEGIMAKHVDSPYLPGKRSRHWLKLKRTQIASRCR